MDACLFGHSVSGKPYSVVVELKGWGHVQARDDANIETWIGGGEQIRPHPSEQVRGYQQTLKDFRRVYQGPNEIGLASLAYCHNYPGIVPDEGLFHPSFDALREASPTFGEHDAECLAGYLSCRLSRGNGIPILDAYDRLGIGPSKSLVDHASKVIADQRVFQLLDEQLAANNAITSAIRKRTRLKTPQVILIRGGPGTGKSVIALNAMGEVLRADLRVYLVSGSSAFTHGMRRILGPRLAPFVRFTDFFWDAPTGSIDVLIVDEAHRMRLRSAPKVPGPQRPVISQVDELIRAARVTVFFVDENQIISPNEVGQPQLIREAASRMGARFTEIGLLEQFRCGGSIAYLEWLDATFGLDADASAVRLSTPDGFDLRFAKSPAELREFVERRNAESPNSARLVSGWCWPWSDPGPSGLVDDIVIGDFRMPWESKNGKRPPPGIPSAKYWAVDPAGVGQVGTVYSMQGFEADHVGVIMGPDLIIRSGRWVANPRANFSNSLRAKHPAVALPYLKRIYRTLLSRARRSCCIYSTDAETLDHVQRLTISY